jgi:hypothetical protein
MQHGVISRVRRGSPLSRAEEGRPAGSGNLLKEQSGALSASGVRGIHDAFCGQSLHASAVKDLLRPPSWVGSRPRAFSSVGESARLITVRSLVRIQKGPRLSVAGFR